MHGPAAQAQTFDRMRAWWAVIVLMTFNIVSLIDRSIISVMIVDIRADLHLNDFQISLVQGMGFAIFYGVMGLVIGGLIDRSSRRKIMFAGINLWSLAACATGLAPNYMAMFGARLMVGVGEGAISPASQSLLSSIFPRHKLSTPMSCFVAAGVMGTGLAFALGGWLLDLFSHAPLGGPFVGLAPWRQVLVVTSLVGIPISFLIFSVREPSRGVGTKRPRGASWGEFGRFMVEHRALMTCLLLGYGLTSMITYSVLAWAPTYARRVLEMSPMAVGSAMGLIVGIGGVVSTIFMGYVTDRLFARGHRDAAMRCYLVAVPIAIPFGIIGFTSGNRPCSSSASP